MVRNTLKTVFFLVSLSALLIWFGNLFGGTVGIQFAFVMALCMNGIAYFFSDKIVLRMYKAQPLDHEPYAWIYDIVDELRQAMKIPMPKLWLIPSSMANAFATGRNPRHASIAITNSLIDKLEPHELRGVLAHELSHIKNRDILIATTAATIATAIGYLANMLQHLAFWGALSGSSRRRTSNPFLMVIVAMLMPIAALLLQLAISRSREYIADETGAHYSNDPLALASALEKLERQHHTTEFTPAQASTAPLFIVHPFTHKNVFSLFATHPPVSQRIARLHTLYQKNIFL